MLSIRQNACLGWMDWEREREAGDPDLQVYVHTQANDVCHRQSEHGRVIQASSEGLSCIQRLQLHKSCVTGVTVSGIKAAESRNGQVSLILVAPSWHRAENFRCLTSFLLA